MAYAPDLRSGFRKEVSVRVRPGAPINQKPVNSFRGVDGLFYFVGALAKEPNCVLFPDLEKLEFRKFTVASRVASANQQKKIYAHTH